MTATLDKAGRVVLPKKIRDKRHLKTGAAFKIEIVGDKIELEQELPKVRIVRNARGRRVVMGWEGFDAAKAVQEMREERMEKTHARQTQVIAFIDTSLLAAAIVGTEDYHRECDALMDSGELGMFAYGLAETFSILTSGRRKLQMSADAASELIEQDFSIDLGRTHVSRNVVGSG